MKKPLIGDREGEGILTYENNSYDCYCGYSCYYGDFFRGVAILGLYERFSRYPLLLNKMKTITDQLTELANGIITRFPEVRDEGKGYEMFDDGGVEVESGEFLYGLVRLLKPLHILETGTYTGISSMYMAQALKDNKAPFESANTMERFAQIFTCDIEQFHLDRARRLWEATGVSQYILSKNIPSLKVEPAQADYDLLFLDSEPQLRFAELVKFYPYLKEGGYILIHDLFGHLGQVDIINPDHAEFKFWPWGELPEEIVTWLKTDKLRVMPLPAPRGMVLFYKPREDDYKI